MKKINDFSFNIEAVDMLLSLRLEIIEPNFVSLDASINFTFFFFNLSYLKIFFNFLTFKLYLLDHIIKKQKKILFLNKIKIYLNKIKNFFSNFIYIMLLTCLINNSYYLSRI